MPSEKRQISGREVGHLLVGGDRTIPRWTPMRVACSWEASARKLATSEFESLAKRYGITPDSSGTPSVSDGNWGLLRLFHGIRKREFAVGFLTNVETAPDGSETYFWNECRTYAYPG